MARVNVEYDDTSIQTANVISQEFEHESIDGKQLDLQGLDGRDGGKLLAVTFKPKIIKIRGQLRYTTQDLLEAGIDDFKELLNKANKNLDIEYAGGAGKQARRRYTCDMAQITLLRRHYHVTFADFEATFVVSKTPFGTELDTTTAEYETIESVATTALSFVAGGNYKPNPLIVFTFTEVAGIDGVRFRNTKTGDWIEVNNSQNFVNNDVIEIDCDNYTVTLNDVAWDYSGFFPSFVAGGNDLRISVKGDGFLHYKATVQIIYYPLYL